MPSHLGNRNNFMTAYDAISISFNRAGTRPFCKEFHESFRVVLTCSPSSNNAMCTITRHWVPREHPIDYPFQRSVSDANQTLEKFNYPNC